MNSISDFMEDNNLAKFIDFLVSFLSSSSESLRTFDDDDDDVFFFFLNRNKMWNLAFDIINLIKDISEKVYFESIPESILKGNFVLSVLTT